ncbi:MAG: cytochrome c4 [Oceanospirillaceae bacterium]|nr:cytochrome c4 [Oceanospirillaceae bacterium]
MKKIAISLMLAAGLVATSAQAGDIEKGKQLSATCAGCHGADGNSAAPTFPKLAGLGERYIIKQLKDFKSGARNNPIMLGMATPLSEEQMADLAAYFSAQKTSNGAIAKDKMELGARIFKAGNAATGVPACLACHGPAGAGVAAAGFPRLAGQHADYIKAQLNAFQDDARTNDGDNKMMRDIAGRMSKKEIEAVSAYVQALY